METIKFIEFYAMEVIVIGTVALTVLAGLYQLIRDKLRGATGRASIRRAVSFSVGYRVGDVGRATL